MLCYMFNLDLLLSEQKSRVENWAEIVPWCPRIHHIHLNADDHIQIISSQAIVVCTRVVLSGRASMNNLSEPYQQFL